MMSRNARMDETHLMDSGGGTSLRSTVPRFIVNQFELKKGDTLRWKIAGEQLTVTIFKKSEQKQIDSDD